jgi:hypothetical protein
VSRDDAFDDELRPMAERLRAERPTATVFELDAIKRRVVARTPFRPSTSRTNGFMTSRAIILTALVLGFLFSSTGAGLAISGFAANDQASVAQYPSDDHQSGKNEVLPANAEEGGPTGQQAVQTTRQVVAGVQESGGDELPFTGFAAIPILVIGLGLVGAGLILGRSARRE